MAYTTGSINAISYFLLLAVLVSHLFYFISTYCDFAMRLIILAYFLLIGTMLIFSNNNLYAHNFYQNQDSKFFTLIKQFEVENNLSSSDLSTNKSNAFTHSKNADMLFNRIVPFKSDTHKNSNTIDKYTAIFTDLNLTTKALIAANLADESLKEYGLSHGLDSKQASNLLNMSIGMIMKMNKLPIMNMTDDTSRPGPDKIPSISANNSFNDLLSRNYKDVKIKVNYETSTMLAKSLKMLFSKELQNANLQNSSGLMPIPTIMKIKALKDLGQGIDKLNLAVNRNSSLEEVYNIVHGQIHPNLFLAFNLKLKSE
jgi:hypothetical protein